MKKLLIIALVFFVSGSLMHSCKKDPGEPPAIPSAGTMAIDFSNFEEARKGDVSISIPKGTEKSNWEFAAGIAYFWKSVMYTTLAVPVTAFQLAASQNPVYIENQTWEWNYSTTVMSETYEARLTGQIAATENHLVMTGMIWPRCTWRLRRRLSRKSGWCSDAALQP